MTRKTRRIIFYIFLLFFIVFVPTIIFYARGYNFDFEKKIFVATGGIYLRSYPQKADIYIDSKESGKTNNFIKRLVPKVYNVKLVKENYHLWQKELTVKPWIVTKAEKIFLVPSNPKIFLIDQNEVNQLLFKDQYSEKELIDIVKKSSKNKILKINNFNHDLKEDKFYFIGDDNLYSLKINQNNVASSSLSGPLVPSITNYTIYKDGIIYSEYYSEIIYELDLTSLKSTPVFDQVFPSFSEGKWILSDDNKKLLCQKDKSVEILWLDDIDNSFLRKKGEIEKIIFTEKINNAIWYPRTDEHLIIATDNEILITELDNRAPRNTISFVTTEKPEIRYDSKTSTLYFLSQEKLYQTEL
jgi:hypothetical protein